MEVVEVQEQHRKQHQYRAEQGVEEELDGGVEFSRAAPDSDQQVHRNQHGFPEYKEEKEIKRHEDAQHAGLQHQEPDVVFLHSIFDRGPRGKNRNPAQQGGEHDEQEGNAVYAENVAGADRGNPVVGRALHEFEAGLETLGPEPGHQRDGHQQAGQGEDVGDPADSVLLLFGNKDQQNRTHQGREKNDRENVIMHKSSRRSSVFSRRRKPYLSPHCIVENESHQSDHHHQRVPLHQAPLQQAGGV